MPGYNPKYRAISVLVEQRRWADRIKLDLAEAWDRNLVYDRELFDWMREQCKPGLAKLRERG
jgi:hypothetical protein